MENKRGMFFTIIVIFLISLFVLGYTSFFILEDRAAVKKRVNTMNNFIFSFDRDMSRQLYISGYRAVFLLEKRIYETGVYIENVSSSFEELFYNSSLYGIEQELMLGATMLDISESADETSAKINLRTSISPIKVSLSQDDPWNIKVSLLANVFIEDVNKLASWNRTLVYSSYIPIENFEDPLYTIGTSSRIVHKINSSSANFQDDLLLHSQNGNYIDSSLAPSFINRLEGDITPSIYGIESLVYIPDLSNQGLGIRDKSIVDYIYFSSDNPSASQVEGMPNWFKLDAEHLNIYV